MASAPSRAAAYELLDVTVEQAAAGDPQVEQYGQIGWRSYVQRMWSWATTPPPDPPMTDDEMSALFGDPAEEDQA
jgi:hypothetical protein